MASTDYAEWAFTTYEQRIGPVIESLSSAIIGTVDSSVWLNTCHAGPTPETRHRLFPGSFFLLWVELLGLPADKEKSELAAAAIELVHNSTLLHDDLIDGHQVRKGQPTLLSLHGNAVALLGGDGLMAAAMRILSTLPENKIGGCINRIGIASEQVVAGQILDEPQAWKTVQGPHLYPYWLQVCKGKLSAGNVAGTLAAYWVSKPSIEKEIEILLEEFSVVSQIINDYGDWFGYGGFHSLSPSLRPKGEEALLKPTLPLIWSGRNSFSEITTPEAGTLLTKAKQEIAERKMVAVRRLEGLGLQYNGLLSEVLFSYFTSPQLPE